MVVGILFVVAVLVLSVVAGKAAFVGNPVIDRLPVVVVAGKPALVGIPLVAGHTGFLLQHLHHCPLKLT